MQFSVPQFVDVEDKIIGPLTLKQFLVVLVGAGAVFGINKLVVNLFFTILISIPVVGATLAIAFGKFNGRSIGTLILSAFSFGSETRSYIFKKGASITTTKIMEQKPETKQEELTQAEKVSRLKKLTYVLDQDIKKKREIIDEKFTNLK